MSNEEDSNALLCLHGELKVTFDSCVLSYRNVLFRVEMTVLSDFVTCFVAILSKSCMIKYQMRFSECIKVTSQEESLKPLTFEDNFFPEAKKETCCGSTDVVGTNVL